MTISRAALLALIALADSLAADPQWQRVVLSGKGRSIDVPTPRALSYFIANPFLRDDSDEFCEDCTPSGKTLSSRKYTIRSSVKPVGTLAGYPVVDVLYYPSPLSATAPTPAKWKSILVQVGPDRYVEIFHLQAFYTSASVGPSRIVQSGNEAVLVTTDPDGGNGAGCWEAYWWFDNAGPHALDFSLLEAAIKQRLAAAHQEGAVFRASCSSLNLNLQLVESAVQQPTARCQACGQVGNLIARFRLDGPVVRPLTIDFHPQAAPR